MGLRSYNILEDATVAPSAGTVTAGYAACATSPMLGYVVATTANRASLSGATLAGVFLGSGVSGSFAPIVSSGHVDSSYVGTLSGSGNYVNVTSAGALQRSSTATADTIGIYEPDGGVWVDLSIQIAGTNATAIQGVAVSSASATRSHVLRGDGTNLRTVQDAVYHATDWGVVADGSTDDYDAMVAFLAALPGGATGQLPAGRIRIRLTATRAALMLGSEDGLTKAGTKLVGTHGTEFPYVNGTILSFEGTDLSTEVGTYISHGTAGSQKHWRMGGWTNLGAQHVGLECWVWNNLNAGCFYISGVYDSGGAAVTGTSGGVSVSLYSPTISAPVNDSAASGTIYGRIDLQGLVVNNRGCRLERIAFDTMTGRMGAPLVVRNPRNGTLITVFRAEEISGYSTGGYITRYAMRIAPAYVPTGGTYYAQTAQDGTSTTVTRVADTAGEGNGNVSEGEIHRAFWYASAGFYAIICHGSSSGQSVVWDFNRIGMSAAIGGYLVPARMNGSAQGNFRDGSLIPGEDFVFRLNVPNRALVYERLYIESYGGFLYVGGGSASQAVTIQNSYLRPTVSEGHPSGSLISLNGEGPVLISGGWLGLIWNDVNSSVIRAKGGVANELTNITIVGSLLSARSTVATLGQPARYQGAACSGLWVIPTGAELDLEEETLQSGSGVALSAAWSVVASTATFTSDLTDANSATNADYLPLPAGEVTGDSAVFGYTQRFCGIVFDYLNGTAGIGGAVTWEFLSGQTCTAAASDLITTTGYDFPTGSEVRFSTTGVLPAGLTAATSYWLSRQSGTTTKAHPTKADALAGTNVVNITDAGTGTHTIIGSWTAFTGVADATNGFTAAAADGLEARWSMPSHSNAANTWYAHVFEASASLYFVRARVTSTYSTNPVLDQAFINHKKTFYFTDTEIANAANNQYNLLPQAGAALPVFGSGADRLKEVYLAVLCRVVRYQAARAGWGLTAWAMDDQRLFWFASTTPGAASRAKYHSHSRSGKVDLGGASYLAITPGFQVGRGPSECEGDTLGMISLSSDINALVDGKVTMLGSQVYGASFDYLGTPNLLAKTYGSSSSGATDESPTILRRRITCTVNGSNFDTTYNGVTTSTAKAAALTQTITLAALLPTNARLMSAEANVTVAVSGGGVATATLDVGWSGQADAFLNNINLLSATRQGESVAGDSTGYIGQLINGGTAIAPTFALTSDVNISGWTAGTFAVDLFYWIMP